MKRLFVLTVALTIPLASGAPVLTQSEQKVLPPEARYWMGATTGAGMMAMAGMAQGGQPSMRDMMRMGMGGVPTEGRSVELMLGSTLPAKGSPEAFHAMPAGAQVNKPIFLQTPEPSQAGPGAPPGPFKQPKGQITFYWGCGEKAGPGQPVVLTFDKLLSGDNDPELQTLQDSVSAQEIRKPSMSNSKTFGEWPHPDRAKKNKDLKAGFPVGSTLAGQHVVEGTYSPKIDFTLPADKTFMDAVRYTSTGVQPSGAIAVSWNAVARATGYALGVMAPEKMNDDSANVIMWSSADRPATFIQMQDLSPAEVNRLIGLKAVLPPSTTTCAVPAEVVKATKEGAMLMFTAFGEQSTFVYPPRPADPKVTWDQEWFARVGFKSIRMDMISRQGIMDMSAMMGGGASSAAAPPSSAPPAGSLSDEEYCKALEAERQKKKASGGVLGGRLGGRLGRVLGGKKDDEEPIDPRCVKK